MTETHPVASSGVLPKRYQDADDETKADQRSRAGIPFLGVEARIVDADTLEPQPWDDKATGELQVAARGARRTTTTRTPACSSPPRTAG